MRFVRAAHRGPGSTVRRLVAVALSAVLAAGIVIVGPAPAHADSLGASGTEVRTFADPLGYGDTLEVLAIVWDDSDSCHSFVGDCDLPEGRVDFYAVQGSTQTYLTTSDLTLDEDSTWFGRHGDAYRITDVRYNPQLRTCCLEPGTYTIRGYYVPGNFDPSSGDSTPVTVVKAPVSVTVTQSASSTTVGEAVSFHVRVQNSGIADARGMAPVGFVDIREGNTIYGTKVLGNGEATITTSALPAGSHVLRVVYTGDDRYDAGESTTIDHAVAAGETTSTLGASPTSITYGDTVALTDTVGAVSPATGTPTGSVRFLDGTSPIGSQPLNAGNPDTATLSTGSLGAGSHTITASYDGDDSFTGTVSNRVTIDVARAATTTSLSSSPNPSAFGQAVTFTAAVAGPGSTTPTGTVQFLDGSTAVGAPQAVTAGVASLTIGSLAGGSHAISALYSGSANHIGSTSNVVTHVVTCDRTITGTLSSLRASSGSTCLAGAKLSGNVAVTGSGSVSVVNSTIGGGISVSGSGADPAAPTGSAPTGSAPVGPPAVTICGSTVAGNVSITGMPGFVLVGDAVDDACAGNWIKGSVTLSGNHGGLALGDNRIGGFAKVVNNVGPGPSPVHQAPIVAANVIAGTLTASGNAPPATDAGRRNLVHKTQPFAF